MLEIDRIGQPVQVADLDAEWLLSLLEDKELEERAAERGKLRLAHQWCVLHPATEETGVATWGDPALHGLLPAEKSLGGEGTPAVSAFAPEPIAAALRISTVAAKQLLADALNLQHRLPRIWARVEALDVPVWKARKAAQLSAGLSLQAARYVDAQLAPRLHRCGLVAIDRVIAQAAARFEPEELQAAEEDARSGWHVTLSHPEAVDYAGTSYLDVAGDSLDLTRFHDLVLAEAERMAAAGDTDPLEVRKAKALGVIAARYAGGAQPTLGLDPAAPKPPDGDPTPFTQGGRPAAPLGRTVFYLHLGADQAVGHAEKLGPVTIERIREWLGKDRVTIRPVIDLQHTGTAVDEHDPPSWMRELVVLRDRRCVFPGCQRDARSCDLDHIDPYHENGPPGQTRPDNLAPLCRRHHLAKTHGRWRYRRLHDGTYGWTSPAGDTYTVVPGCVLDLS